MGVETAVIQKLAEKIRRPKQGQGLNGGISLNDFNKNIAETGHQCIICEKKLYEYQNKYGKLEFLGEYIDESRCYCRDCWVKISQNQEILNNNLKWLEIPAKTEQERGHQLMVIMAKEFIELHNNIKSNNDNGFREKARSAYTHNVKEIMRRFTDGEYLL